MKNIRILLADEHEIVRFGVRGILEQEEDMEIVADCSSTDEALFLTEVVSPNVILMDTDVPGMGGIEATRHLLQKKSNCKVILLTLDKDSLPEALEAGVAGYLLEDINHQELIQAIRKACDGELVIDERLTSASQVPEGDLEYLLQKDMVREAELVIHPPFEAAQLLRFIYQVEKELEAIIVQEAGSWSKGTAITIAPRNATPLPGILDKLGKIPEVQDVIEKPMTRHKFTSLPLKTMAGSANTFRKEFQVTLKQADTA